MTDFGCLNFLPKFIWKELFCRALANLKPYKISLTQQDNTKLFIMFEKLGCDMLQIKIVLEMEIQIYELQSAAKMINPVCSISWKGIQSPWSINGYCFYKTSQFCLAPQASQITKCY